MKQEELKEILEKHKRWLYKSEGWSENDRANLQSVNLANADFHCADLRNANFQGANLDNTNFYGANLCNANLSYTCLCGANFYNADLREVNFCNADLQRANFCNAKLYDANLCNTYSHNTYFCGAKLCGANLSNTNLYGANFSGADLREADLYGVNLREADLYGVSLHNTIFSSVDFRGTKNIPFIAYTCPDSGAFRGFKSARGFIIVLEIPEDAKRLSANGRKCRCNKAKVLQIQNMDGTDSGISEIGSNFDKNFIYKVGEMAYVEDFDDDRWNECSTGIHFFINRQEAVDYTWTWI